MNSHMERARAARDYIDRAVNNAERQRELEVDAFMAIFHPDHRWTTMSPAERKAALR